MRHGTCLNCKVMGKLDTGLTTMTAVTEALADQSHHHHAMTCDTCGAWWFEDVIIGGLGLPVAARRDTVLCGCPDDDQHTYSRGVITVPVPESECHCTAADVNSKAMVIRTQGAS